MVTCARIEVKLGQGLTKWKSLGDDRGKIVIPSIKNVIIILRIDTNSHIIDTPTYHLFDRQIHYSWHETYYPLPKEVRFFLPLLFSFAHSPSLTNLSARGVFLTSNP